MQAYMAIAPLPTTLPMPSPPLTSNQQHLLSCFEKKWNGWNGGLKSDWKASAETYYRQDSPPRMVSKSLHYQQAEPIPTTQHQQQHHQYQNYSYGQMMISQNHKSQRQGGQRPSMMAHFKQERLREQAYFRAKMTTRQKVSPAGGNEDWESQASPSMILKQHTQRRMMSMQLN